MMRFLHSSRPAIMLCLAIGGLLSASLILAMNWQERAKLTANDAATQDYLGYAVALSGDTAVAGAPRCDPNNQESCINGDGIGEAYVFVRPGTGWAGTNQVARLTPSDGAGLDTYFGSAVAIDGDTIVIGARYADIGGNDKQGAVYVFVRPAGGWADMTETVKLTASDGLASDGFGHSVDISGETIIVGSHLDDTAAGSNAGSAYVFVKPAAGWAAASGTETAKLTAGDGAGNDRFGQSVAIEGETAVAGAWLATVGANTTRGAAYVFTRPASGWANMTQTAKLTASDGNTNDQFGVDVDIHNHTIVVGAFFADLNAEDNDHHGAGYVYVKPAGGWITATETVRLTASDFARNDKLARNVAVYDHTVVLGAYQEDAVATNSGSQYAYAMPGGGWSGPNMTETMKLTASDGGSPDYLGFGTAVDGGTILGGAPQHDLTVSVAGAVYVYPADFSSRISGDWHTAATWANNGVPGSDDDVYISAGHTVLVDGDAQARRLVVERGATLIIPAGVTLTVAEAVLNHGRIQQTRPVNNGRVSLPLIQSSTAVTRFIGVTLDTPHDLGLTTVTVRSLNPGEYCTNTGAGSPVYARRCYNISPTNNQTATVRLWFRSGEQNGLGQANLAVYRYEADVWTELMLNSANGTDGGDYVYAEAETPGFSHFLAAETGNSPTAVSLKSITVGPPSPPGGIWLLLLVGLTAAWIMRRAAASARHLYTIFRDVPVHNRAR